MGVPDRSVEFQGTCPCGAGELQINHCTPDHGWPTATPEWYETSINCRSCCRLYILDQRGKEFVLVEKAKLETQQREQEGIRRRIQELMSSPEVKAARGKIVELLKRQPSKAAVFRLLNGARLVRGTQGTFYRHWSGPDSWVSIELRSSNLSQYLALAGITLPDIEKELRELHRQEAAASVPVAPFGKPVHIVD